MQKFKSLSKIFLAVVLLVILGSLAVSNYSFLFSRRVKGVVVAVKPVQLNVSVMQMQAQGEKLNPQLFSSSVAIREESGEILTASAEDRQWAVVQEGNCAEATYYPYPPWQVMKAGTYFGARLDRLYDCAK